MIKQVNVLDLEINKVNMLTDFINIPRFQRLQTESNLYKC